MVGVGYHFWAYDCVCEMGGGRYKKMLGINIMSHTLEKDDCDSDMAIDSTIIQMKHMLRIVEGDMYLAWPWSFKATVP